MLGLIAYLIPFAALVGAEKLMDFMDRPRPKPQPKKAKRRDYPMEREG